MSKLNLPEGYSVHRGKLIGGPVEPELAPSQQWVKSILDADLWEHAKLYGSCELLTLLVTIQNNRDINRERADE